MKHLDNREEFTCDEEFANFRSLILNNCASSNFYRSASAIRNTYGRAETVRTLMKKLSIKTIIDFSNVGYRCMSDEFGFALTQRIREILTEDGAYIIQCDAGKKRTGFVCIILEMLSGTNYDYIVSDYLESYKNNNGIDYTKNLEFAKMVEPQKTKKIVQYICDTNKEPETINLIEAAKEYLLKFGMSKEEIRMLQNKLI